MKHDLELRIKELETLRSAPQSQSTIDQLAKALKDRNNYLVSKAAAIVGDLRLRSLTDNMVAAFERFLVNPVKSDSQCWAKNALAKALKDLEYDNAEIFLKGLAHYQLEPVWQGRSDTAATLRGTCALALVACRLNDLRTLTHLVDALADPEVSVRVDAARAIAQLSSPAGALVLRFKVLTGDAAPEVVGQCFASLLSLAPSEALPLIARFLKDEDRDIQVEAIASLGECNEPQALTLLQQYWEHCADPVLKTAVLMSVAASPLPAAAEFLISVISEASIQTAAEAITALAASRFRSEWRDRVSSVIASRNEPTLAKAFQKEFESKLAK